MPRNIATGCYLKQQLFTMRAGGFLAIMASPLRKDSTAGAVYHWPRRQIE
jgi:hypothetical protein